MSDDALVHQVREALKTVMLPSGAPLADFPGLSEIIVTKNAVAFAITIVPGLEASFAPVREQAEKAVAAVAGDKKVMISITSDKQQAQRAEATAQRQPGPPPKEPVKGVKNIIAIASGKGGVGKSTTAVNFALALKAKGQKVAILDADIYGPSMPKLLGIEGKPAMRDDGIFTPHEAFGLKVMSIGSMLEGDQAVVWRGPMATSALRQLLRETDWGDIDTLVIDLPPGTGDVHISLVQTVPLTGAIVVSTPQDLALIDAKKAIDMFVRTKVSILGIIENMSYFLCPSCGERSDIFGTGGAEETAKKLGVNFLGGVPLHMDIRERSDAGTPIVATAPASAEAKVYLGIAEAVGV
jgi:ATP-binding protein involved in chromosome partitioning